MVSVSASNSPSGFLDTRWAQWLLVAIMLLAGLAVRLYDLTDEPLDFHATRQLRGAIIARSIYYAHIPSADPQKRQMAIAYAGTVGQYEPPILENIVAFTYRFLGGEKLWVARIYNSLFWLVGGLVLFALASRFTSPAAAFVSLAYYLFLAFSIQASRSFQPDPDMVVWMILCAWGISHWARAQSWRWAIVAGIFGGMAILTKPVAIYPVAGMSVVVVLSTWGARRFLRQLQVWTVALLMVAPTAIFLLMYRSGASDYIANWTVALSHLLLQPWFYVRWFSFVQVWMGFVIIVVALVGVLVAPPRLRILLLGLWAGYFIYGLTLPYQMYTHNYYSLMLVPILGLSLAPVAQPILSQVRQQRRIWQVCFVFVALLGIVFSSWEAITTLKSEDFRNQPAFWQKVASYLPPNSKILALTQDYGYPLLYYGWRKVSLWPINGEQDLAELRGRGKDFNAILSNRLEGMDYFLVTAMGQLNAQTDLKKTLYTKYPILAQGDGYIIFDLDHPLSP